MNQQNDNTNTNETQDLLTTKQAAKFLGVSKRTIQRYRKEGILTPQLVKGSCRYSKVYLIKGVTSSTALVPISADNSRPDVNGQGVTSSNQGVTRSEVPNPI